MHRRFGGFECAFGLGFGEAAKGNEHGIVNCSAIVEKKPNNFLESGGDFFWVEGFGLIGFWGHLDFTPVDRLCEWRRGMLGTSRSRDLEAFECLGNIAGHGQEDGSINVVPIKGDTAVELSGPIGCHFIFTGDDGRKVFGVLSSHVLDPEVIYYEREEDGTGVMAEEARGVWALVIAVFGQMWD